jgi:hypothetical protein
MRRSSSEATPEREVRLVRGSHHDPRQRFLILHLSRGILVLTASGGVAQGMARIPTTPRRGLGAWGAALCWLIVGAALGAEDVDGHYEDITLTRLAFGSCSKQVSGWDVGMSSMYVFYAYVFVYVFYISSHGTLTATHVRANVDPWTV